MSSIAINPMLVVFRWAANISCGWIFTFLSYNESKQVFFLNACSFWYLKMRSRKKKVDICILDTVTVSEVVSFVPHVWYFLYYLILGSITNPLATVWRFITSLRLNIPAICPVCQRLLLQESTLDSVFPGESRQRLQMISRLTETHHRLKKTKWQDWWKHTNELPYFFEQQIQCRHWRPEHVIPESNADLCWCNFHKRNRDDRSLPIVGSRSV